MDIEIGREELLWMLDVYRGEFRRIPPHVVKRVIAKGFGIANLGGAFNLTAAGRELVRRAYPRALQSPQEDEEEGHHIVRATDNRRKRP